jgi:hypothetical protein
MSEWLMFGGVVLGLVILVAAHLVESKEAKAAHEWRHASVLTPNGWRPLPPGPPEWVYIPHRNALVQEGTDLTDGPSQRPQETDP